MVTDPGRLVAGFRHGHDLQGMARPGAAGARDGCIRPRAQIPAESASGPARAAAQLDHDRAPAPRHLAGELSEVGAGPRHRDRAERGRSRASARRAAGTVAAAAQQRHRCSASAAISSACANSPRCRNGRAASIASLQGTAPCAGRLQGTDALSGSAVEWLAPFDDGAPTTPGHRRPRTELRQRRINHSTTLWRDHHGTSWRTSVLADRHRALGSKLEDWNGMGTAWTYAKDVAQDHVAIRTKAGLMDVSGLKKMYLVGPHASAMLNYATTRDVTKIYPGKSAYACMLNDAGLLHRGLHPLPRWARIPGWWCTAAAPDMRP